MDEGQLLWRPDAERIAATRLTRFARRVGVPLAPDASGADAHYAALHAWSLADLDTFWDAVWSEFDLEGDRGAGPVRAGGPMPVDGLRWFPRSRVNYAENLLRAATRHPERVAVSYRSDDGSSAELTGGQFVAAVGAAAAGLRRLGVGVGDRVAGYLPNRPEAVVMLLATASLGAVWSSCAPEFGAESVVDRFRQIGPAVLVAVDGYRYGGRAFDRTDELAAIRAALPELRATVVVPVLGRAVAGAVPYAELLAEAAAPRYERVPFDHPLWILYSSGTTGLPKPLVHGHGGMLLEHAKVLGLHLDLGEGDVFFWYTTTGWMMWNFLVSGLLLGARIVLYDGAPTGDILWRLAAEARATHLGLGAQAVLAARKAGLRPREHLDLGALRFVGSTGSPLPPEGFAWVYEHVAPDALLGSLSGGTDVCSAFVGPVPTLPVRAGVLQGRALGAAVEAFDVDGHSVIGEVGELVLTAPMPCMPIGLWGDDDGSRYRAAYFADFPGVWRHGDWITVYPDGGCVISGRSDATLNRGGVRMGTSDFYRVAEDDPAIADTLVVDTGRLGDEGELVLFVQAAHGAVFDADAAARLRAALRARLSPRHVPDRIVVVRRIPRTLSGKKTEVPVRRILLGADPATAVAAGALADPDALAECVAAWRETSREAARSPSVGA